MVGEQTIKQRAEATWKSISGTYVPKGLDAQDAARYETMAVNFLVQNSDGTPEYLKEGLDALKDHFYMNGKRVVEISGVRTGRQLKAVVDIVKIAKSEAPEQVYKFNFEKNPDGTYTVRLGTTVRIGEKVWTTYHAALIAADNETLERKRTAVGELEKRAAEIGEKEKGLKEKEEQLKKDDDQLEITEKAVDVFKELPRGVRKYFRGDAQKAGKSLKEYLKDPVVQQKVSQISELVELGGSIRDGEELTRFFEGSDGGAGFNKQLYENPTAMKDKLSNAKKIQDSVRRLTKGEMKVLKQKLGLKEGQTIYEKPADEVTAKVGEVRKPRTSLRSFWGYQRAAVDLIFTEEDLLPAEKRSEFLTYLDNARSTGRYRDNFNLDKVPVELAVEFRKAYKKAKAQAAGKTLEVKPEPSDEDVKKAKDRLTATDEDLKKQEEIVGAETRKKVKDRYTENLQLTKGLPAYYQEELKGRADSLGKSLGEYLDDSNVKLEIGEGRKTTRGGYLGRLGLFGFNREKVQKALSIMPERDAKRIGKTMRVGWYGRVYVDKAPVPKSTLTKFYKALKGVVDSGSDAPVVVEPESAIQFTPVPDPKTVLPAPKVGSVDPSKAAVGAGVIVKADAASPAALPKGATAPSGGASAPPVSTLPVDSGSVLLPAGPTPKGMKRILVKPEAVAKIGERDSSILNFLKGTRDGKARLEVPEDQLENLLGKWGLDLRRKDGSTSAPAPAQPPAPPAAPPATQDKPAAAPKTDSATSAPPASPPAKPADAPKQNSGTASVKLKKIRKGAEAAPAKDAAAPPAPATAQGPAQTEAGK